MLRALKGFVASMLKGAASIRALSGGQTWVPLFESPGELEKEAHPNNKYTYMYEWIKRLGDTENGACHTIQQGGSEISLRQIWLYLGDSFNKDLLSCFLQAWTNVKISKIMRRSCQQVSICLRESKRRKYANIETPLQDGALVKLILSQSVYNSRVYTVLLQTHSRRHIVTAILETTILPTICAIVENSGFSFRQRFFFWEELTACIH